MERNNKKSLLNEIVDVNGSKVFVENGEVKTILNENIQQSGYMSVDEAFDLIKEQVRMIYAINNSN
ncbi:MAG: hypothetical protein HDS38_07925 [Bacteroides sp.]|nr:hypothetical protein [Bacteroides sp.]